MRVERRASRAIALALAEAGAAVGVCARSADEVTGVASEIADREGRALYFSRAPIPWLRDAAAGNTPRYFKHIGLYVYRREALLDFPTLPPGELERAEQLEQLRWLENGFRILVAATEYDSISVDVPEDVARAIERIAKDEQKRG